MSSLIVTSRILRRPASPPVDSILIAVVLAGRTAAADAMNSAAFRSCSRSRPLVSPGSAFVVRASRIDSTSVFGRRGWAVM
jgi:hypothetical protein